MIISCLHRMRTIYLVLVGLVVLVGLSVYVEYLITYVEFFENRALQQKYKTFIDFYNPFMVNWTKAVTTSWSTKIEQPPLTDGSAPTSSPTPTRAELNEEVAFLAQDLGPLPPITNPFPAKLDASIPKDPKPFITALTWLNTQMQQSHEQLKGALTGAPLASGFEDMCAAIHKCQEEKEKEEADRLVTLLDAFNNNAPLQQLMKDNQALTAKSKQIQNDAQSGALMDQVELPAEKEDKITLPPGSDALQKLKESDPNRYAALQSQNKTFFDMKTWSDQINANLK